MGWRIMHNSELCCFYRLLSVPSIGEIMQARMSETKNAYIVVIAKPLRRAKGNGRKILGWILGK
jgi:hypothetical protein